jgi:hypothetical protein
MNRGSVQRAVRDPLEGHTRLPHVVYDLLLTEELTKRELLVLLLVVRLTYGCRREWAIIRQADLRAVGIGANHAWEALEQLRVRKLLVRDERTDVWRVGAQAQQSPGGNERRVVLQRLLHRQLFPNREALLPKMGTLPFPNEELLSSQNGKQEEQQWWAFDRSASQFVKGGKPS